MDMDNEPSTFSPREFAIWLSAWIDADGSIMFLKVHIKDKRHGRRLVNYRPAVQVTNAYKKPLEYMKNRYGGCIIHCPRKDAEMGWWKWQTENLTTIKVLKDVAPFLVRKKEQAEIILDLRKKKITHTYRHRPLTDEEMILLEECRQKIRALNRKHKTGRRKRLIIN